MHATTFTIDSGGLAVIAGNVGIGTTPSANAGLTVVGTYNAVAAFAYGVQVQGTVVATTNGSTLNGIQISTAYSPGAFTGVTSVGLDVLATTGGAVNNYGIRVAAPSGAGTANIGIVTLGGLLVAGSTPPTGAGQFAFGGGTALGNGANTNMQAAAIGTGTGPASLTVSSWLQVSLSGVTRYMPIFL